MKTDDELIEAMLHAWRCVPLPPKLSGDDAERHAMRAVLAVVRAHDGDALAAARAELLDTTWQDHADHWQKRAEKAEAEAARLRAAIKDGPHDGRCRSWQLRAMGAKHWADPDYCNCWKAAALQEGGR